METGLSFERVLPGVVPEIDERDAARYGGYAWREWLQLPRYERVDCFAAYTLHNLIDAHSNEAAQDAIERKRRQS